MNDLLRDKALAFSMAQIREIAMECGISVGKADGGPYATVQQLRRFAELAAVTSLRAAAPVVQQGVSDEQIDNATAAHFGLTYRDSMSLMLMHRRFARAILSLAQAAPAGVPADTQRLDFLEQAYTDGARNPAQWREFMASVAEYGFRKTIDAIIPVAPAGVPLSDAPQAQQDDKPVAAEPVELTRSIIHDCPAIKLPQTWLQKLGNTAQIVALKGASQEIAEALAARINTSPAPAGAEAQQDAAATPFELFKKAAAAVGLPLERELEGGQFASHRTQGAWNALATGYCHMPGCTAHSAYVSGVAAPAGASELPPLPKPRAWMMEWSQHAPSFTCDKSDYVSWHLGKASYPDGLKDLFTAAQMHDYARAALSGAPAVAAAEPLTPEQIREIAHRTCTEYRHMERVRYGFAEMHLWEFVRRVEAAHGIGSPGAKEDGQHG